jgi:hypothetical protein
MSENFNHAQEAESYLSSAADLNASADGKVARYLQRQAQGHATLAQVDVLREIADTLKDIAGTLDAVRDWGIGQTAPDRRLP